MKIEQRKYQLIQYFLYHQDTVTSEVLARYLNVTSRTVREDLKELTKELAAENIHLLSIQGKGFYIDDKDYSALSIYLKKLMNDPMFLLSAVENSFQILRILFLERDYICIEDLAEKVFLGKSSVEKEFETVENWLKQYNLVLKKKKTLGIRISGAEKNFRIGLIQLIYVFSFRNNLTTNELFSPIFDKNILQIINDLVNDHIHHPAFNYSQFAYQTIILYLAILIWRVQSGSLIEEKQTSKKYDEIDFLVDDLLGSLAERLALEIPLIEFFGFDEFLAQQTIFSIETIQLEDDHSEFIIELLTKLDSQFHQGFIHDARLIEQLNYFIHKTKVIDYGFKVEKPFDLNTLKNNYPSALDMALYTKIEIEDFYNQQINDHSYIELAILFSAALEKKLLEGSSKKWRAAIINSMGFEISSLLQSKIQRLFPQLILVGVFPTYQINDLGRQGIDFLISTSMIENCTIPFVEITNFLDDNDYLKIGRFLKEIEQADFEKYFFQSLFEESIFITDIKEKTPQKIISKIGNRLVEVGHVSPSFIDAALTREKTMATDIGNLVAIPHALSYGRKSSIAVGLLNDVVDWGNEKVKIVFLLNIRYEDIERMKSIFSYFYDLVQSKKKINQLIDTKQFDMFIQILKKGEI